MSETVESQGSFADALNATQRHTVPVLPAYGAPRPLPAEGLPTESQTAPTARRTVAFPGTTYARATRTPATSDGSSMHRISSRAAASGRRDEPDRDDADLALAPGRPTFVLPVITSDRLPAVQPTPDERQVAVRKEDEPQAVFIPGASKLPTPHLALAPRRHRPRPFIIQFLVAMVTVMTLFAVLTLASPLGKGMAYSNSFQAYANAMPWVPTPTPTPKPTPVPQFYGQQRGVNPGQTVIINTIKSVFGAYAAGALNIARCESGYDPNAYNSYPVAGSHAEGVFQILYPSTWSGTSYARYSPYDYNANIRAAYEIFHNDGNSWREWECQP
ncbi:MAG TPA: hypothetical protein VF510_26450 [Ktedonobacterales bacterium]